MVIRSFIAVVILMMLIGSALGQDDPKCDSDKTKMIVLKRSLAIVTNLGSQNSKGVDTFDEEYVARDESGRIFDLNGNVYDLKYQNGTLVCTMPAYDNSFQIIHELKQILTKYNNNKFTCEAILTGRIPIGTNYSDMEAPIIYTSEIVNGKQIVRMSKMGSKNFEMNK